MAVKTRSLVSGKPRPKSGGGKSGPKLHLSKAHPNKRPTRPSAAKSSQGRAKQTQQRGSARHPTLELQGQPQVTRTRVSMVGLFLFVPILWLWWSFAQHQMALPSEPLLSAEHTRGRIVLSDGKTVLASSFKPANGNRDSELRSYPQGALAGHLLGFKGRDQGLSGLEFFADARLRSGQDVSLTIDPVAQDAAEAALERALTKQEAQAGSVVMLEAKTNRILAMATAPKFNPAALNVKNLPDRVDYLWRNRATSVMLEPGSTVKALVAAALLDTGKATPESQVYAPMSRLIGKHKVDDAIKHPSDLNLRQVLRYSSNVGISKLAEQLSARELHAYLKRFGFGGKLDVEGVPARAGVLRQPNLWRPVDFATATFGQGISSSVLGLATAFSVLTNDGLMVKPQLIEGLEQPDAKRVLGAFAAQQTRGMLKTAVKEGIPWAATIKGYCIGGKTGTAQVSVNGRYSDELYDALFAGFFPCEQPRVTMVVEVYGAKKQHHGSQVAAPAFREIAEQVLAAWGVAPDAK